ncbi:GIY-YIG nuclease family protein [Priestia aryabhattai]
MMIKHFGVTIKQKPDGMKATRDNYIKISSKSSFGNREIYSDEYIKRHTENCLYNYDLNMNYFDSLSKEDFNEELVKFINETKVFEEITDLAPLHEVPGYYVMVLDEYAQVYIGSSNNIKKRIQAHWTKQKQFDRLIFGNKDNSVLSIDSFRAHDNTRIFVYPTSQILVKENDFINQFNDKYYLNRTKGGALQGLTEAIINGKTRGMSNRG